MDVLIESQYFRWAAHKRAPLVRRTGGPKDHPAVPMWRPMGRRQRKQAERPAPDSPERILSLAVAEPLCAPICEISNRNDVRRDGAFSRPNLAQHHCDNRLTTGQRACGGTAFCALDHSVRNTRSLLVQRRDEYASFTHHYDDVGIPTVSVHRRRHLVLTNSDPDATSGPRWREADGPSSPCSCSCLEVSFSQRCGFAVDRLLAMSNPPALYPDSFRLAPTNG